MAPASVSAASFPETRNSPYIRSLTGTTSPAARPIRFGSTAAAAAGTVSSASRPAWSAATMAVSILARLAGARGLSASFSQSTWCEPRSTRIALWALRVRAGGGWAASQVVPKTSGGAGSVAATRALWLGGSAWRAAETAPAAVRRAITRTSACGRPGRSQSRRLFRRSMAAALTVSERPIKSAPRF